MLCYESILLLFFSFQFNSSTTCNFLIMDYLDTDSDEPEVKTFLTILFLVDQIDNEYFVYV